MSKSDTFNLLESRHHVRKYRVDKHPPKETIDKILWRTWKTTPSKNNFMPYYVHVLGPDQLETKIKLWEKSVANHKKTEESFYT